MTHPEWTDRLSAYLDHELSPRDALAVEEHLVACPSCRQLVEELRSLILAAPAYQGTEPSAAVWNQIAAGIEASRTVAFPAREARRFTLGQLVAAAAVVAMLVGSGVWLAVRPGLPTPLAGGTPGGEGPAPVTLASQLDDPSYRSAVRELEAAVEAGRGTLDTATVRIIEENLAVIDQAIAEARAAIDADPSNVYLGGRIQLHMQRKLVLLRQAARAAGAAS